MFLKERKAKTHPLCLGLSLYIQKFIQLCLSLIVSGLHSKYTNIKRDIFNKGQYIHIF